SDAHVARGHARQALSLAWRRGVEHRGCRRRIIVMSYVQRVLQPGEQVRHISSIHWIVYWPGGAVALLAVVAFWLSDTRLLTGLWRYTAYTLALVAVVLLIQQWFQWWVTEIAVTN